MDIIDYLLLDYLVELPATLNQLCSDNIESIFNKPHHGLSATQIVSRLQRLESLKYIEFELGERRGFSHSDRLKSDNCFVHLTSDGGEIWQKFFEADWSQYVEIEFSCNGDSFSDIQIKTTNENMIFCIIQKLSHYPQVECLKNIQFDRLVYWKRSEPVFILKIVQENDCLSDDFFEQFKRNWCHRIVVRDGLLVFE